MESLFVKLILEIFLEKNYFWQDNYKINKLLRDIKNNNKFKLGSGNNITLSKLKILRIVDLAWIDTKDSYDREEGTTHIFTEKISYYLVYDNEVYLEDDFLQSFLPKSTVREYLKKIFYTTTNHSRTLKEMVDIKKEILIYYKKNKL